MTDITNKFKRSQSKILFIKYKITVSHKNTNNCNQICSGWCMEYVYCNYGACKVIIFTKSGRFIRYSTTLFRVYVIH